MLRRDTRYCSAMDICHIDIKHTRLHLSPVGIAAKKFIAFLLGRAWRPNVRACSWQVMDQGYYRRRFQYENFRSVSKSSLQQRPENDSTICNTQVYFYQLI